MASWHDILEEQRRRQEEEEERAGLARMREAAERIAAQRRAGEEARAAQRARAARPTQPSQPPQQPQQPQAPTTDLWRPPVDTGTPQVQSSQQESDTARSPWQPPTLPSASTARSMEQELWRLPSLSDRLRGAYDPPNRPLVPAQAQGPAAQPEQQDPWKPPSFAPQPQQPEPPQPRYQLLPDEPYDGQNLRRQMLAAQPEPVQNRIGSAMQQGWNDVVDWWTQTPEYQTAQERTQQRRGTEVPGIAESAMQGIGMAGGVQNPIGAIGGAAAGAAIGALNQTDWGREAVIRGQDFMDRVFEVPGAIAANAPIPGLGVSASELLTPGVQQAMQGGIFGADDQIGMGGLRMDGTYQVGTSQPTGSPLLNTLINYLNPGIAGSVAQTQQARRNVAQAIEQGNPQANLALRNLLSGADNVQRTLELLTTREQRAGRLEQMATQIQGENPVLAGEYFLQAQELRSMTNLEAVESNMNPLAEFAYGMVFDPTNLVGPLIGILGLAPEAQAARRAGRATNVTPAEATRRLTQAVRQGEQLTQALTQGTKQAQQVYRGIVAPFQGLGERITDATALLARTPESRAALDTEQLWQGLTSILSNITDKQDLQIVLGTLLTEPGRLVTGLNNLTQDAMQRLAQSDGFARWGAGLVGQNDFVRRVPLLKTVQDELASMRSLQGTGLVNPYEFYAELHGLVADAARRANGGKLPDRLPFGASQVQMVRLGQDNAVVAYLDEAGKVIQRGVETTISEAQRRVNEINKAMQNAGKKGIMDIARIPADIQRAIMSDVWLGMRPANWMGNALGATTSLFANNAYTLTPISQVQDYLSRKFGGVMPNQRLQEVANPALDLVRDAKSEISSGAIDNLARIITRNPDNVVSRGMKALYDVPYGSTEINLPGGLSIPFGEGAFYSRAYYVPFKRTFDAGVVASINQNLVPVLQQIEGMTPQTVQQVGNWVMSLAESGSKSDVAQGIRKLVGKPEIRMTLKELGVPPELLSPQAARQIELFLSDTAPSQAGRVMQEISHIIAQERNPAASVLNLAPTQPGVLNWTDQDMTQEAAWMADVLVNDAIKAGVDPAQAQAQAREMATSYLQGQHQAYDRVFQDLAGAPNQPDTWSVVMDFWQDVMAAKSKARHTVDELGREAASLNMPDAWARKWEGTRRTYDTLRQQLSEYADATRLTLQEVMNGQTYSPRHDWWETIEQYMKWDEVEWMEAAQIELGRAVGGDPAQWQRVINANRERLDNALYETFGAFQRFPSLENFDIARNAIQKLEAMGAQVRYNLDQLLQSGISGSEYARARNAAWKNYFDGGVRYNQEVSEAIVRNGILDQAGVTLKWTEGDVEYQLTRPSQTEGKFWARNTATGKEEEFTIAQSANEASPFTVPQQVVDDYNRLMGNDAAVEAATAQVMQQIADSAPPSVRTGDAYNSERFARDEATYQQWWEEQQALPAEERLSYEEWWAEQEYPPRAPIVPDELGDEATFPRPAFPNAGISEEQLWGTTSEAIEPPRVQDQPRPAFPAAGLDPWTDEVVLPARPRVPGGQAGDVRGGELPPSTPRPVEPEPLPDVPSAPAAPALDDIRREASDAGVATATKDGRPTDKHLVNSLNKRLGIKVRSLDELTPEQRVAAVDALKARKEEQVARMSPAEAQQAIAETPKVEPEPLPAQPTREEYYAAHRAEAARVEAKLRDDVNAALTPDIEAKLKEWGFIKGDETVFESIERVLQQRSSWNKQTGGKTQGTGWQVLSDSKLFGDSPNAKKIRGPIREYARGIRNRFGMDDVPAYDFVMKQSPAPPAPASQPAATPSAAATLADYGQGRRVEDALPEVKYGKTANSSPDRQVEVTLEGTERRVYIVEDRDNPDFYILTDTPHFNEKGYRIGTYGVTLREGLTRNEAKAAAAKYLQDRHREARNYSRGFGQGIRVDTSAAGKETLPLATGKPPKKVPQAVLGKEFDRMSSPEILAEVRDELLANGYTERDLVDLVRNREDLLSAVANVRGKDIDELDGMKRYDFAVPSIEQLLGVNEGAPRNTIRDWILGSRRTGNNSATQVGDVAEETIRSLNDLERALRRRLPEILAGQPNQLTGAQKLRVVDAVLDWLPEYDNALAKAQRVGDRMAGWMMLNYQDRRNFDTIMSLLTPYHYFWSRMPSRVAMAALTKPALVNLYYEMQRSVDLENDQADVPDRLRGTLPIPGTNARLNVMAPLRYAIPAMSYLQPNPFVEEDPRDNGAQKWVKQYEKWGPGLNLYIHALLDMSDGKMDRYYGDVLNSMIPIPGPGGGAPVSSVYQRLTGNMPAKDGVMAKFGFGPDTADDGFGIDAYRARRAVSYIGVEEKLDPNVVYAAQQIVLNQFNGNPIDQDVDPNFLAAGQALAERGVKRAAEDRIAGRTAAYNTMMSVQPLPQAEQDMRRAGAAYNAAAYDETTNPLGSKEVQRGIIEGTPELPVWWSKNSDTPGLDGRINALYDQIETLKAEDAQGNKQAISKLYDEIETLKAQEPVDPAAEAKDPYKGMNPKERAQAQQQASASEHWDAYHALPDTAAKAEYLRENPDFQEIYKQNIIDKGEEPEDWWTDYGDKGGKKGSSGTATAGGAVGLAPGSVSRDDFTDAELDQYYEEYFAFNGNKDWDGQKAWLLEHPEFARLEADRKLAKDGEYPWWYDDVLGGEGAAGLQRPPSQPTSVADVLRRPYDPPGTGDNIDAGSRLGRNAGSSRRGRGGRGGSGGTDNADWSQNWDEYRALGEDWAAKRQYMLDNPEFAAYYIARYGEEAAWWLEDFTPYVRSSSGGWRGGGGGGGGSYATRQQMVQVDPRYMDRGLWESPGQQRPWIPYSDPTPDWLRAGEELGPDSIRRWQPQRWF